MRKWTLALLVVTGCTVLSASTATAAPPPDFGACIVPGNGNCVEISELLCILINGEYQGDGSTCPPPPKEEFVVGETTDVDGPAGTDEAVNPIGGGATGACIVPGNGNCVEVTQLLCILINGDYGGDLSKCPDPEPDPKHNADEQVSEAVEVDCSEVDKSDG